MATTDAAAPPAASPSAPAPAPAPAPAATPLSAESAADMEAPAAAAATPASSPAPVATALSAQSETDVATGVAAHLAVATPAPAPAATLPPVRDECKYKNRLQELTMRTIQKLPIYHTESEGEQHQPSFRSTVQVGTEKFYSARSHNRIKDAEQDAAKVAYEILSKIDDDEFTHVIGLIDQVVVFSKSILHEFSVKTKAVMPSYTVDRREGLGPKPKIMYVSSVLFAGNTYIGEAAKNKKEAEQKAACVAVKSILATNDTCMLQIIRSKKSFFTTIISSDLKKETEAPVSQENNNAPTNALSSLPTIKFVTAVGSSCLTINQGANINSSADPSAQTESGLEKRKRSEPHDTEDGNENQSSRRSMWSV